MATLPRNPHRRRQRSIRVSVAFSLMALATGATVAAASWQSLLVLTATGIGAVLAGWLAARMLWTEVVQSRREHAADRATTARQYQQLAQRRARENTVFATTMTQRLSATTLEFYEAQAALEQAQRDLARQRRENQDVSNELAIAQAKVAELTSEVKVLRARIDELVAAGWDPATEPHPASVEGLVSWDAQASELAAEQAAIQRAVKGA